MQSLVFTTDGVPLPLALAGALLQDMKRRQRMDALDVEDRPRPEVKHGDVVAHHGLLALHGNGIVTVRRHPRQKRLVLSF